MSGGRKKNSKNYLSVESMIRAAILLLQETPGSTFNSIYDYIKSTWRGTRKEKVLETMKKMRKKEELVQIKYYFRLSNKEVYKELKRYRILPMPIPVPSTSATIGSRVRKRYSGKMGESEHTPSTSVNSSIAEENDRKVGKKKHFLRHTQRPQNHVNSKGQRGKKRRK